MKKVLVIGAGIGQYYIAKKIKERGDYLVTVTLPGKQPVIDIADKVCYENVFDKEGVLAIARREDIDAVISDQNDLMMPTVAYVAEHMGLPGNSSSVIDSYCNKNHYRDNCDFLGIPVPRHTSVISPELPEGMRDVSFPWVVKPADSQSSVGVSKVSNTDEYKVAIVEALAHSKTHSAIVEEFFSGQELVAEGFIYKGRYYNLGFADRRYFKLKNLFIPSQTLFPSLVPKEVLDKITMCEEKMAEYIKPEFAIVHSEYLYNPASGEYKVVESALRGGGVYISSHLVPLYSGIDINDVLLDCIEGKDIDMNSILSKRNNRAAGYICFYLPAGKVVSVSGIEDCRKMECIKMMEVADIHVNMLAPPLTHKGQRLGPILLDASSREELEENIKKVQYSLRVEVLGEDGETRRTVWD